VSVTEVNQQLPPSPPKATDGPWNFVSSVIGAVAYLLAMYRFQTYTERNNIPGATYALFAAIMFLLGFGLGLVAAKTPARAVTF